MFKLFWEEFIITKDVKFAIFFVLLMIVYWIKNKLFRKAVLAIIKRTPTTIDDDMYPLLSQLVNLVIVSTGVVFALLQFGVNVNAILATAGASSLAIAFALKDTLTNIMSGIMLMVDRPFRIGDDVKLASGDRLTVLDIGLRRTKFGHGEILLKDAKTKYESVLIIPNVDLVKNKVYNYTYAENLD